MEKISLIALSPSYDINWLKTNFENEFTIIVAESIDDLISEAFSTKANICLINKTMLSDEYASIMEDVLENLCEYIIIEDNSGTEPKFKNIHYYQKGNYDRLSELLKSHYFSANSKMIREKVLNNISPIFSELSQCLLQINQDISYSIKQNNLKELDKLYLEIRPILDAFHFMDNVFEQQPHLSFPLLEKLRFFIVRYQTLSQGKLLFSLESVIRYNDLVVGSYHGITTLLELIFCYCIIHTEYGLIHIQITNDDDKTLKIHFYDTGTEQSRVHTYGKELENSYEMLAILISKFLGYKATIKKNDLEGFEITLELNLFTDNSSSWVKGNKVTFNVDRTKASLSDLDDLQVHYRELIHELIALLKDEYSESLAPEWRKMLHRIWPSVEMMGDKSLAAILKKLHNELKANPKSKKIEQFQTQVKNELSQILN